MKSFEEACTSTFARVEMRRAGEDDAASDRRLLAEITADAKRWQSLAAEVAQSELGQIYVGMLLGLVGAGNLDVAQAIRTAFIQGTIVGVEMERNPLEVPPDSVPGRRDRSTGNEGNAVDSQSDGSK